MKKILLTLAVLLCAGVTLAQNADIHSLLERLEQAPPSLLPMRFYVEDNFTPTEQQQLIDYYESKKLRHNTNPNKGVLSNFTDFFAQEIWSFNDDFGTIPITPPFNFSVVASIPDDILFADDYNGSGTLYGLEFYDRELVTIDPITAQVTTVGPLTGLLPGHIPSGLAWNPIDETMYALSGDFASTSFTAAQLYSIDLATGALTAIGDTIFDTVGFWLAISNDGEAFLAGRDNLFAIDLATGVPTLIGPYGFTLNYTQDASFDPSNNILYAAALRPGQDSVICEIDITTGAATILGAANGDEYGSFSVLEDKNLGVESYHLHEFSISPNPAIDTISIEVPLDYKIDEVNLYNILGMKESCVVRDHKIDISHLSSGMYLLHINVNGMQVLRKVIKQ